MADDDLNLSYDYESCVTGAKTTVRPSSPSWRLDKREDNYNIQ
jgi:hypothetical protein